MLNATASRMLKAKMEAKVARTVQMEQGKRIATEQKACPVPAMCPYTVLKDIPDDDFFHGPGDCGNL